MSLAGRLEDLSLADIFQILSIGRKTGTLTIKGSKGTALIVFKNGMIVRGETDDLEKSLADTMRDAGLIKDTVFHLATEVKTKLPSKSMAEILLDLETISKNMLEQVTKKRIETVIYRLLYWEDGDFQFEPDDLEIEGKTGLTDLGWELGKGLSPEYLLMEGARVQDESSQASFGGMEDFSLDEPAAEEEEGGWDDEWGGPQAERKDISSLKALTQELRAPNSTSEITLLVLRCASDIFQRGVLFMVGKNAIVGLGQFGLEIQRADDKIRETVLNLGRSDFLTKIVAEQIPFKGSLEKDEVMTYLIDSLGGQWPAIAGFFPIIAEGKVVAVLYADNVDDSGAMPETEGLEIFISHAGLALEKSLLQRRLQEMEKGKGASGHG